MSEPHSPPADPHARPQPNLKAKPQAKPQANSRSLTGTAMKATLSILVIGFALVGVMYWSLNRGATSTNGQCGGKARVGDVKGLLTDAKLSPTYSTLGGRCEYLLSPRDGVKTAPLTAYKATLAGRECKLKWEEPKKAFLCGSDVVLWPELQTWPSREIREGPQAGSFEIDFG